MKSFTEKMQAGCISEKSSETIIIDRKEPDRPAPLDSGCIGILWRRICSHLLSPSEDRLQTVIMALQPTGDAFFASADRPHDPAPPEERLRWSLHSGDSSLHVLFSGHHDSYLLPDSLDRYCRLSLAIMTLVSLPDSLDRH